MVKRGSQKKFGGKTAIEVGTDKVKPQTNPLQFRRLDGKNDRIIELAPVPKGESAKTKVIDSFKSVIPFTKANKRAKKDFKEKYPDFIGTSPFIGFGPNLNPTGLIGSGKAALALVPKTPASVAGTILAGGVLFESGVIRKGVAETPERLFELGRDIGKKAEDIAKDKPLDGDQNYPSWLKKLLGYGLTAGVAAGATGLIIDKVGKAKDKAVDVLPSSLPKAGGIASFQNVPFSPANSVQAQPTTPMAGGSSAVIKEPVLEKVEKKEPKAVTINNNISIKNSNKKTEKFINTVYA